MTALSVRMRPDLILEAGSENDAPIWIATDPVALKYFRLRAEEVFVLRLLDGQTSLEEIRQRFEATFAPLRIDAKQLYAFVLNLHAQGLTIANVAGQGEVLWQRGEKNRSQQAWQRWGSVLAFRLPGIPAEPLVQRLYPLCQRFFSPLILSIITVAAGLTLAGVLLQWATFQTKLAQSHSIFVPQAAVGMLVVLACVKGLHELGHALACRHGGAKCHEIGVLLLVGTPTLYCDVTDAWRLPSKWQRILISSAGMLVELVLATIAVWLWWFSAPGLLNTIALQVMFICSVGTLLFNLNPLVRCDGYYILSDGLELPNLWQDSRGLLRRTLFANLLGLEFQDDPTLAEENRRMLLAYAIGSVIYSWLLTLAILTFIYQRLEPLGLGAVAILIGLFVIGSLIVPPVSQGIHALLHHGRRPLRRGRLSSTLAAAITILGLFLFLPVPKTIVAPVWLDPEESRGVYVPVAGRLEEILAHPGSQVTAGQPLVRLANEELQTQIAELTQAVRLQETKLKNLRLLLAEDASVGPLIPTVEKTLADYRERVQQRQQEAARLTLFAPTTGTVIPPQLVAAASTQGQLASWHGLPFDRQNQGCQLEMGTLVCHVAPTDRFRGTVVIHEHDRPAVRVGQMVRLKFASHPGMILTGTVREIAKGDEDDLPAEVVSALQLPQGKSPRGRVNKASPGWN
jgi:putative peptide zinc metalloprotease protein